MTFKIESVLKGIEGLSNDDYLEMKIIQDNLLKPKGSLGKLEGISCKLAGIYHLAPPPFPVKPTVAIFAGDHGVVSEGVTQWSSDVTSQMVGNFLNGKAGVNVLANVAGCEVVVVDVGIKSDLEDRPKLLKRKVGYGTKNIRVEDAMSLDEAYLAVDTGINIADELIQNGSNMLISGDMGIGNTTASAAIIAAITRIDPRSATGRGTGITDSELENKIKVITDAIARSSAAVESGSPFEILSSLGGYEIGAISGFILGAAYRKIPVIVDGVISLAGALLAHEISSVSTQYLISGHRSTEPGASKAIEYMGLDPILDLDMRLGEGSGAVLAYNIVKSSIHVANEMATFDSL